MNEVGELILKNKEIANNDYFGSIIENLNLESWEEDSYSHINKPINHINDVIQ